MITSSKKAFSLVEGILYLSTGSVYSAHISVHNLSLNGMVGQYAIFTFGYSAQYVWWGLP